MLFLGDTVDRLAVQLITNTALGKGKRLPLDIGYLDTHDQNFKLVRPFKDVTKKEIDMYNIVSGISPVAIPAGDSDVDRKASVYSVTEKFVFDLQVGFTQTVTTLIKTGDKLCSTAMGKSDTNGICRFCSVGLLFMNG